MQLGRFDTSIRNIQVQCDARARRAFDFEFAIQQAGAFADIAQAMALSQNESFHSNPVIMD